jgi:superfamily II helicase
VTENSSERNDNMEEKELKECLECSTKNELIKKMKIAGLRYTGLLKSDLVDTLEEFLLNKNNIHKIWKELTPFEREYIEEFLRYDELPSYEKVEYLHEKYGIKKERFKKPWEIESKIKLIFQLEAVPYPIKKY